MDRKIKLVMLTSLVAVMATGCSNYRGLGGGGQGANSSAVNNGSGTVRTGQVAGGNRVFGQNKPATCSPCASNTTGQQQSSYTYKPATTKPAVNTNTGKHSQQWYVDRWNRQQQQGGQKNTNYTGYGSTDTKYVDYTSTGSTNANVNTSNKSIYTGSYQQQNTYKPYNPTTYSGGSSATTNTASTYSGTATGGSTYTVKKGDTVFEVMRQTGVYWKDIISMNNLVAPAYTISPGQRLKLK